MSEEEIEDTSPISLYETKYAPKTIDDLILNVDLKNMIKTYTANKRIKNLLLCGRPGIGKCHEYNEELEIYVDEKTYKRLKYH